MTRSRYRRRRRGRKPGLLLFAAAAVAAGWFIGRGPENIVSGEYPESDLYTSFVVGSPEDIPDYCGEDVIELNAGLPCFSEEALGLPAGEYYSENDRLGRCRSASAMLESSMMPEEPRENIGDIRPTGWVQEKYPGIVDSAPPYLYNRCHLIAYAMTGQNGNERNLITGTRYMNVVTMLPYEKQVLRYLDRSDNHVLYRVTPYFKGRELVARGVEMEAYSVEDCGEGVCFHVFVYNIQPGIEIDYASGKSRAL